MNSTILEMFRFRLKVRFWNRIFHDFADWLIFKESTSLEIFRPIEFSDLRRKKWNTYNFYFVKLIKTFFLKHPNWKLFLFWFNSESHFNISKYILFSSVLYNLSLTDDLSCCSKRLKLILIENHLFHIDHSLQIILSRFKR